VLLLYCRNSPVHSQSPLPHPWLRMGMHIICGQFRHSTTRNFTVFEISHLISIHLYLPTNWEQQNARQCSPRHFSLQIIWSLCDL
jgi:hypothetical protein